MKRKDLSKLLFITMAGFTFCAAKAQKQKQYELVSPGKKIKIQIVAGRELSWSVTNENTVVLQPSAMALHLMSGEVLGSNVNIVTATTTSVNEKIQASFYKKSVINDQYNQLLISCKGDWGIIFRAYDDGVAYRFFTNKKDSMVIASEDAEFQFTGDDKIYAPYANDPRVKDDLYSTSFEALYHELPISKLVRDSLVFLPVLVELENGVKTVITESDQEDYPGMYISGCTNNKLNTNFAGYPLAEEISGHRGFDYVVTKHANYIAKLPGKSMLPWRTLIISNEDRELLNNDMVYRLASPNRVKDISWIKPGKVSWDWWNNWNISGVDFKSGINTETYKYYIDFAAANKLEYIILDEGWSPIDDLFTIKPGLNLQEIIDYGKKKNVGVILWTVWRTLYNQMDEVMSRYEAMGVKGFKIDFLDRDDQKMVASTYTIAAKAAAHHLLIDFHGVYKPAGLMRTYPNVINYEAVRGMENVKWAPGEDFPRFDVSIPFIRMIAGPMDFTPGAMRNAAKGNFRPVNANPMSQGTRVHQLAMYVVFEGPLQMLSDNPTVYTKEQESTDFIDKIPTVFDETVALDGKVGEFAAIARKKDDVWYVGAMTNWMPRQITISFSFLGDGQYEAEIFKDGVNADKQGSDYRKEIIKVTNKDKYTIDMAPGGGWAARIYKAK